jgi:mersacidin/lichenicidin family type 2 lantibiotic
MSNNEIIRAWKDPKYRATLSQFPPLPIGYIELDDPYLHEDVVTHVLASRPGEHTTVVTCQTHSNCTHSCHTVSHCPHTGWQCKSIDPSLGLFIG